MNLQPSNCTPIDSNRIVVADLARAMPEFAPAPADETLGISPSPGARRVFHIDEVKRLSKRFGVNVANPREVCFEWPVKPLSRDAVVRAMKETLGLEGSRIEVLAISSRPVPKGKVTFPLLGLLPPGDRANPVTIWRGFVTYGGGQKLDVWARIKLTAPTPRVVAVNEIPVGHVIAAEDVRVEVVKDYPFWRGVARSLDQVEGHVTRESIAAGGALMQTHLTPPLQVKAGDTVDVDVESGHMHLRLEARAENSGREGEMISVRNPRSGKTFRARVEGKGKVIVLAGLYPVLVN